MKGWTKLLAQNRSGNNEGKYMLQAENYINKSIHKNADFQIKGEHFKNNFIS